MLRDNSLVEFGLAIEINWKCCWNVKRKESHILKICGCHEKYITHSLDTEFERYSSPQRKSDLGHKTYHIVVLLRFGQIEEILHVMEHVISILCYINRSHDRYLYMKFSIENNLTLYGLSVHIARKYRK